MYAGFDAGFEALMSLTDFHAFNDFNDLKVPELK